jgi:septal ring factor EnvC (AmiA/AmiB activator)
VILSKIEGLEDDERRDSRKLEQLGEQVEELKSRRFPWLQTLGVVIAALIPATGYLGTLVSNVNDTMAATKVSLVKIEALTAQIGREQTYSQSQIAEIKERETRLEDRMLQLEKDFRGK